MRALCSHMQHPQYSHLKYFPTDCGSGSEISAHVNITLGVRNKTSHLKIVFKNNFSALGAIWVLAGRVKQRQHQLPGRLQSHPPATSLYNFYITEIEFGSEYYWVLRRVATLRLISGDFFGCLSLPL